MSRHAQPNVLRLVQATVRVQNADAGEYGVKTPRFLTDGRPGRLRLTITSKHGHGYG